MNRTSLVLILVVCLRFLNACGSGNTTPPPLTVTQLSINAPSPAIVGVPFQVTVTALGASGQTVTSYTGTVHFTSTDSQAVLPADSQLGKGTKTFSVTLKTAGGQSISVTDTVSASITGTSNSVSVIDPNVTHFSVVAPATATIGTAFTVTVSALDSANSLVTTYAGTVQFTSTDGQAVLPTNSTLINGSSSFTVSLKTMGGQQITAADTATASITGTSSPIVVAALRAESPVPFVNQPVSPDATVPGTAAFPLTVNGTGFVPTSVVNWNGKPRTTTFVNKSQLNMAIEASDLASSGTAAITVTNPAPGGGASNEVFFVSTLSATSVTLGLSDFAADSLPSSVAVGDFNGDGKLDLAVTNQGAGSLSGNVSVLLGKGDGTFQAPVNYAADQSPVAVAVGDFNGDGKLDLAVVNTDSNNISVLLGNGDGTFQAASNFGTQMSPRRLAVADFNADGKLDIVVTNMASNTVSVLLGNGEGTFQSALDFPVGNLPQAVAVGDFNGDGKLDLVVPVSGNNNGSVNVLLGNGDGTFQAAINNAGVMSPVGVTVGDFNGDGKLDLAVADNSNSARIFLGNGDGTFRSAVTYDVGIAPISIALGDFNGDGKPDLVAFSLSNGSVSILLGNGDGTFQSPATFSSNAQQSESAVAVGDFNGDGRLDVAVADFYGPGVSVLLQTTTVTLSPLSVSFNNQVVGSASAAQTLTLTNTGDLTLDIAGISITGTNAGDFHETNTCPSSLAGGASCNITVTFSPTQEGPLSAAVSVADNSAGSPQTAALTGIGLASGANVSFSPATLAFPGQLLNTTSSSMPVTLTNYGTIPVNISNIAVSASFAESQSCPASLAPLANCIINITFTPTAAGNVTGTLTVTDDASGSPQNITLTGIGAMPTTATLVPNTMGFSCTPPHLLVGGCTPPRYATLTNTGSSTLYFHGATVSNPVFSVTSKCPGQIEPGQSCTLQVSFGAPISRNKMTYTGTLVVNDTASDAQQIALTGTTSPY